MLCLCRYAAAWKVPTAAALIAARRAGTAHNTSELEHSLRRTVAVLNTEQGDISERVQRGLLGKLFEGPRAREMVLM
jgi:hypothetical protein